MINVSCFATYDLQKSLTFDKIGRFQPRMTRVVYTKAEKAVKFENSPKLTVMSISLSKLKNSHSQTKYENIICWVCCRWWRHSQVQLVLAFIYYRPKVEVKKSGEFRNRDSQNHYSVPWITWHAVITWQWTRDMTRVDSVIQIAKYLLTNSHTVFSSLPIRDSF